MPELIVLSELKQNLYKEGSPLVIPRGALQRADEGEAIYATLSFRGIWDRPITSVLVDLHIFDRANIEIEVIRDYLYLVPEMKRDQEFGSDIHIEVTHPAARSFSVAVRRVAFTEDVVWDGSASLLFEAIPERRSIAAELEDDETIAQFVRDFADTIAKDHTVTAKFVPAEYKNLWLCSCGEINRNEEDECFRCGAMYLPQRTHIDNRVQIATNLAEHKRLLAEKAEQARLEAERKALAAKAAKEEAERLAAEEKARQEAREKRRQRNRKIFIAVSIPTLIAIILYFILLFAYFIPQGKYNEASALLQEKRYDEAITAFSAMGSYGDSPAQVAEAKYQKAELLLSEKNYSEAIAQYAAIENERDVTARIAEAKYQEATGLLADKNFAAALALFTEISDYEDTPAQIQACHFGLAQLEIAENETPTPALSTYAAGVSEADAKSLQPIFCKRGTALYKKGNKEAAAAYFALVTDPEFTPLVDKVYYDDALALLKNRKLDEAEKILLTITEYKDSKTQLLRTDYLRGEIQREAGKYTEAIAFYKKAKDYKDSADKILECNYQIAAGLLTAGEYSEAEARFLELGSYQDAAGQAVEARYQRGLAQLANGDAVGSYNTLYPLRNDDRVFALLVSNSQYYIYVYDVGVGPNPLDQR